MCLQYIIYILFLLWTAETSYISPLFISLLYFTATTADRWTASLSYNSPQTSLPLPPSLLFIHSCYSPFQNDHDLLSFWSRSCCKLDFGAYYFLKHVPTLKWLVCAKSAVELGDSRLCVRGERWSERERERGVEKQLRCWLLGIKTFPSTNRAAIDACQTRWTTAAPVTEQ